MVSNLPTLRWGILPSDSSISAFIRDLRRQRESASHRHIVQAILLPPTVNGLNREHEDDIPRATVYDRIDQLLRDDSVDVVYIASIPSLRKAHCLQSIVFGKPTISDFHNARDTQDIITVARANQVFLLVGLPTRFTTVWQALQDALHEERLIGDIRRVFCDNIHPPSELPLENTSLSSIFLPSIAHPLAWALLVPTSEPTVDVQQTVLTNTFSAAVILNLPSLQVILTTSMLPSAPGHMPFGRIDGTLGSIFIYGSSPRNASRFVVTFTDGMREEQVYQFGDHGEGWAQMADAIATDLREGRVESERLSHAEMVRVAGIMETILRGDE